jgi:hypothetical protein
MLIDGRSKTPDAEMVETDDLSHVMQMLEPRVEGGDLNRRRNLGRPQRRRKRCRHPAIAAQSHEAFDL